MSHLTISLLGPFEVRLDGEPLTGFPSAKVRALLAYLAAEAERPHPREVLAGLLWPDYPERSAHTSLSNALSHLRTLLGDRADDPAWSPRVGTEAHPYLLVSRETVQLNPQADCRVDVTAFTRLAQADPARATSDAAASDAAGQLDQAVALYRGSFLEGFSLRDSPPFEQWALVTRERVQRQMIEALGRLSAHHEEEGDYARACGYARRQLEIDPGHEEAHRALMRLLALNGQRSAALAQYEACVRALREELGVEPSMETVTLYEHIAHASWARDGEIGGQGKRVSAWIGKTVGPFLVVERLGEGAMAEVFKAYQPRLERYVALKFIRAELVHDAAAFEREARILARLSHPNIVHIYDLGVQDNRPYLAMEYIQGSTLKEWHPEGGRLTMEQALPILRQVGAALDYVHSQGIIHRDVKPANVMLTPDGRALLADFGIARLVGAGGQTTETQTTSGTPAYMSPEQVDARVGPIGPASDVYALGMVAYELLTGHLPFVGETPLAALVQRLTVPPPPPRQYVPDLPVEVEAAILKALARQPADRYPSAGEFVSVLDFAEASQAAPLPAAAAPPAVPAWWPKAEEPGPPERPLHNLPTWLTPFVGREAELAELSKLLADPEVRLVTVLGPGGMGKTRLAVEVAAREVGRYEHGVWFASLVALQSVESVVPAVAQAMGFQFSPGGDPRQQLLNYLREKRMLLVLDNWEQLLAGSEAGRGEGTDLLSELLAAAPQVQVLATSRARLNLQGEHAFPLSGMSYPALTPTPSPSGEHDAMQYSAVQLFLQSAWRVHPDLGLEEELDPVVRLCRLVEGMPLALVLAAAWVEMLSPDEIAAEVERSLDFLSAEWRDLPDRQRSVRAVFDGSWRLLSEREQAVFAAMAVFRGGFTREAAGQAAGADLRMLASLMNKSLLERDPSGRYGMHELLRQYGEEKLGQSPDGGQMAHDRHSAYYMGVLARWTADMKGPRQRAALAEMDREFGNVRAAWDRAVEQAHWPQVEQGAEGLFWYCDWRSGLQEAQAAYGRAAERLEAVVRGPAPVPGEAVRALIHVLAWQAYSVYFGLTRQGYQPARRCQELLARPELAGQDIRRERALALWLLCGEMAGGDKAVVRALLEQSLALYRELGDRWHEAHAVRGLATVDRDDGNLERSREMNEAGLSLFRALEDEQDIVISLQNLILVYGWLGRFDEAERAVQEGMARARGDRFSLPPLASYHGLLLWISGRFAEAVELWEKDCRPFFEECGDRFLQAFHAAFLARFKLDSGDYAPARALAEQGLAMGRELNSPDVLLTALQVLARWAMLEGRYPEARQLYQEMLACASKFGASPADSWCRGDLAAAELRLGEASQAQQHLCEALRIAASRAMGIQPTSLLLPVAEYLAHAGRPERAVEIHALALRYPFIANSRWCQDVFGKSMADATATLPPEVVAAAQERGRARDLQATIQELAAELEKE